MMHGNAFVRNLMQKLSLQHASGLVTIVTEDEWELIVKNIRYDDNGNVCIVVERRVD